MSANADTLSGADTGIVTRDNSDVAAAKLKKIEYSSYTIHMEMVSLVPLFFFSHF